MRVRIAIVAAVLGYMCAWSPIHAQTTTLTVLASNGIKAVLDDLAPQLEHASGRQVVRKYDLAANLQRRIEGGESFDVAVVTPAVADNLAKAGKLKGDTRVTIARSSLAIAIRAGTRKRDITTNDGFSRALVDAKAVAYAREGASAGGFFAAIDKLGIRDRVKTMPLASGAAVGHAVVSGEADYGILPMSEILPMAGAEVLDRFPADVRAYAVMVGGVSASSSNTTAAKRLIEFLMTPSASDALTRHGMER
jgi:molybdate transport system substrate-binding protein